MLAFHCYLGTVSQGEKINQEVQPISKDKVSAAMMRMNEKAAGPDDTAVEAWKYLETVLEFLTRLFHMILESVEVP